MSIGINTQIYYRVKYYQIIMMDKRHYIIPDMERQMINHPYNSKESKQIFIDKYVPKDNAFFIKSKLDYEYKHSMENKTCKVIYVQEILNNQIDESKDSILAESTNVLIATIDKNVDVTDIILISRVKFSSDSLKKIHDIRTHNIQIFLHKELFYDPTNHTLVPTMEIIPLDESRNFLKKPDNLNIKKICFDDPIIKFLGGIPGQLVKVTRKLPYISNVEISQEYRLITKLSIQQDMR